MKCELRVIFLISADSQKQAEADNITAILSQDWHFPSEAELKTAAQLAQEGYMSTVEHMRIMSKNISEISSDNIGKLASIVTYRVDIYQYSDELLQITQRIFY